MDQTSPKRWWVINMLLCGLDYSPWKGVDLKLSVHNEMNGSILMLKWVRMIQIQQLLIRQSLLNEFIFCVLHPSIASNDGMEVFIE